MGTVTQWRYNWYEPNGDLAENYPTNIGIDLFNGYDFSNDPIIKLSIKAPPGTRTEINGNIFIVGVGGTLTINKPGYEIKTLRFIKDYEISQDVEASTYSLQNGLKKMDKAISALLTATTATVVVNSSEINVINEIIVQRSDNIKEIITSDAKKDYYNIAFAQFLDEYIEGYKMFRQGTVGIYKPATDNNGQLLEKEIYNVLIDIEYKGGINTNE